MPGADGRGHRLLDREDGDPCQRHHGKLLGNRNAAERAGQRGANRWPASSLMVWPLSIGFFTIASASQAYSSGRPARLGNAASLVRVAMISSEAPSSRPVANRLGAIVITRSEEH